jgi:hypothetical protein
LRRPITLAYRASRDLRPERLAARRAIRGVVFLDGHEDIGADTRVVEQTVQAIGGLEALVVDGTSAPA